MAQWNETPAGNAANDAYNRLKDAYTNTLPGHIAALAVLASRPIQG